MSLTIPGYRDLRPLGSGSFADVFSAEDESLSRRVAIKVLRERTPNLDQLSRFRRERETLASLNHPHVLRVHAAGSVQGRPFVVTELLSGRTLLDEIHELSEIGGDGGAARRAREGRSRRLLAHVHQAALGVAALHSVGLVHRDVKPENLLIDHEGRVKVADLGLVGGAELQSLTAVGTRVGTPAYMAPELCRGERGRDPAVDVYSLGATLFQVLTGALPHLAPSLAALVVMRVGNANPDPRRLAPGVSAELASVCQRAMELDPQRRYPDAGAFAEALAAAIRGSAKGRALGRPRLAMAALLALLVLALPTLLALRMASLARSSRLAATPTGAGDPEPSPPPPSVAPSPLKSLASLEAALLAGEAGSLKEAARWIRAKPSAERGAEGLRAAARCRTLMGPPTARHELPAENPPHAPLAWPLASDDLLWTELCHVWCPVKHSTDAALRTLAAGASPAHVEWSGHHVTAVDPQGTYWATLSDEGECQVYRRTGTSFAPFAELPSPCHALLADAERVACGLDDGGVVLLEARTGRVRWLERPHKRPVIGLTWLGGALGSFAQDELSPLALLDRATGAPRKWEFNFPSLGAIRWVVHDPLTEQLVVCQDSASVIHGLQASGAHLIYSGERRLGSKREAITREWSPDALAPRAAVRVGRLLVTVGNRRAKGSTKSEVRIFLLENAREVAARAEAGVYYTSVSYSEGRLLIAGTRGAQGILHSWDLRLPSLATPR